MFLLTNAVNIGPSVDVKGHAQAIDRSEYENSTRTAQLHCQAANIPCCFPDSLLAVFPTMPNYWTGIDADDLCI